MKLEEFHKLFHDSVNSFDSYCSHYRLSSTFLGMKPIFGQRCSNVGGLLFFIFIPAAFACFELDNSSAQHSIFQDAIFHQERVLIHRESYKELNSKNPIKLPLMG